MSLQVGIVGLPNVGKSTLFNALTGAQNAEVANYPFCTIKPNRAVVPVPDERVEQLATLLGVPERIHAVIEFIDIAGLVEGASRGEGLGNQFLGTIRETAAIIHVVRCFEDTNVVHISEHPDPLADIEVINLELALADLQTLERKIERLDSAVKGDPKLLPLQQMCLELQAYLHQGHPASSFDRKLTVEFLELNSELRFLTAKPVIYLANVDEESLTSDNPYTEAVKEFASRTEDGYLKICARLEAELVDLPVEERADYMELAGIQSSGLSKVIQLSHKTLKLISFFTRNQNEVRAWNIPVGTTTPRAAGVIHTDFEKGFIKAEVIPFEVLMKYKSDAAVKAAGQMQLEGRDYVVDDGDVIQFRFNV